MNLRHKLQHYRPLTPLKDNLAQVKNAVEAIVSIVVANQLPLIQNTLVLWLGEDIAIELLALSAVAEAVIVYIIISGIEYFVTDYKK